MNLSSTQWQVTWLLRLIGASICFSFLPIFFPLAWMEAIHEWLGLDAAPQEPIFEYLARSLSAMYFAHGCVVLALSTDVPRYRPLIKLIALLNTFLGIVLFWIDFQTQMPSYWRWLEGPPIILVGLLLFSLASKLSIPESEIPKTIEPSKPVG